jgi:hypothetical protein
MRDSKAYGCVFLFLAVGFIVMFLFFQWQAS